MSKNHSHSNFLIISIMLSTLFWSCQGNKDTLTMQDLTDIDSIAVIKKVQEFDNIFRIDNTIERDGISGMLTVSNTVQDKQISAICNCEKNVADNTMKIQITAVIPTKSELKEDMTDDRFPILFNDDLPKKGQFKYLTFHLRNDIVEKIQLISMSTDKDYNGSNVDFFNISKYEVNISTFDYSIASNVYGNYRVIMPESFGYIENDTTLTGMFICNNWRINTLDQINRVNFDT